MLSLSKKLDDTVLTEIGELPIDLSFNNVLRWYEMVEDKEMTTAEKIKAAWYVFLGDVKLTFTTVHDFEVASDAIQSISDYISQDPYTKGIDSEADSSFEPVHWFSYTQDADAIYASFFYDYGIDLIDEQDKLRWEKFRALFNNLSSKSPIMRIIDIRQTDLSKYEGKELTDLAEAQSYYSLESQSVEKLNDQLGGMFSILKQQAK